MIFISCRKTCKRENIQIIEVDGPDLALDYFPYNLISMSDPGLVINKQVIKALITILENPLDMAILLRHC
jgi:hypothetical protein